MGYYNRLRITPEKIQHIAKRAPQVLEKMLQFHTVRLRLLARIFSKFRKKQEYGTDTQRYIKILEKEKTFNCRVLTYVKGIKRSQKELAAILRRETSSECQEAYEIVEAIEKLIDYLKYHFTKYKYNLKSELKIVNRLNKNPQRKWLVIPYTYSPEKDIDEIKSVQRQVWGGLTVLVDAYENREKSRMEEFLRRWKGVQSAKKVSDAITPAFPLFPTTTVAVKLVISIYQTYILKKRKIWEEYSVLRKEIVSKVGSPVLRKG